MVLSGPFENLRNQPIPPQDAARIRARSYRKTIPIDAASPHFGEKLVEARDLGLKGENYYHSERNPPYWGSVAGSTPGLLVRRTVGEKLARANRKLGDAGLEFYLFDAWRPRGVQEYFHDIWMPAELVRRGAVLRGAALEEEVERYWAAPSLNADSPAPHATGGAVDLTLRWKDGEMLWMGSIFDDVTALAHRDRFEMQGAELSYSDEEARACRRLLHWVLDAEGFAGHPNEWWHFSWGDQLWASLAGHPAAHYGLASVPG